MLDFSGGSLNNRNTRTVLDLHAWWIVRFDKHYLLFLENNDPNHTGRVRLINFPTVSKALFAIFTEQSGS